jgi:16S rRNA processing protein RimM
METLACAKILSSHGIKGEFKVKSLSGETEHFFRLKEVYIERSGKTEKYAVESVKEANKSLLIKLKGIDNPELAKEFQGLEMRVERDKSCPVYDGEFYCTDLVDSVVMREKTELGKVKSIIDSGGRYILEVENTDGHLTMIPFMKMFIEKVDLASHMILLSKEADIF